MRKNQTMAKFLLAASLVSFSVSINIFPAQATTLIRDSNGAVRKILGLKYENLSKNILYLDINFKFGTFEEIFQSATEPHPFIPTENFLEGTNFLAPAIVDLFNTSLPIPEMVTDGTVSSIGFALALLEVNSGLAISGGAFQEFQSQREWIVALPALPGEQGFPLDYPALWAVPVAVPEPLTLLGTTTALSFGIFFKRLSKQQKKS